MTEYKLNLAKEIERRLVVLNSMKDVLEDTGRENVCLIATGQRLGDAVELSEDMRTVLLGMCIGEISKLNKVFNEL